MLERKSQIDCPIMVSNKQKFQSLRSHKILPFYKINQYIGAVLRPLKEAGTKKLCKPLITVYGPSAWYFRVKGILQNLGASKSKVDDAIFYRYINRKLEGIMC